MLLKDIKTIFHKELDGIYPIEEVDSFFYRTIEHHLDLERFVLALQPKLTITKEEEQPLFETLAQLKLEKPLQYIFGKAHFLGLELDVNEHVLIPRPETEELVEWVLADRQVERSRDLKILDIGTGSGCIAIALAKNLPEAQVYALDVSEEALQTARKNALKNNVDVNFLKQNILEPELDLEPGLEFNIIVSNPPYVREQEKEEIKNNVKVHEPKIALFVSDDDPLEFYKAILQFAKKYLMKNGKLYFEVNQYLAKEAQALLEAHNFSEIELRKDIFENYRMLKGTV